MSLSEALQLHVNRNYAPALVARVAEELAHILSEGDRVERQWVQRAIADISRIRRGQ